MPPTPAQIKDKLTNALDSDKNVRDEKAVEEVITLLEASTLTKEILEQTRLGRDINHVRKVSKNPTTAKRARNLVKSWKKLLVVPNSPLVNGHQGSLRVSPGLSPVIPRCSTPNKNQSSPALTMARQQQSLKIPGTRSPVVQPCTKAPLPTSKLAQQDPKPKGYFSGAKSPMPIGGSKSASINPNEDSNLSWPATPPAVCENSHDRLICDGENAQQDCGSPQNSQAGSTNERNFNLDHTQANHSMKSSKSANRPTDQRNVSKTNVANRKRTRSSTRNSEDFTDAFSELHHSKQPRLNVSSPSLSATTRTRVDVINGSVVKKNEFKSDISVSDNLNANKNAIESSSRVSLQEEPELSSLPGRINQKTNPLHHESSDSRMSMQSTESRSAKEKINRVKTTEQLIEHMQRKSATAVGTKVIAQIRTNQIQKESDFQKTALPTGVKRRGRKKKGSLALPDNEPSTEGQRLAQTKSEYIERFLQTSVTPTPGEDEYESSLLHSRQESQEEQPMGLVDCGSTFTHSPYEVGFPAYPTRQDKLDSGPSASPPDAREINMEAAGHLPSSSKLPDVNVPVSERWTEEQILSRLPPVDYSNIDWTSSDYAAPQAIPVTAEQVDRLHGEDMEGVNGCYDRDGQFQGWAEMLTMDSIYDEPLFILPYVMPND